MLGKMSGREGRRPGGQPKSWHRCLLNGFKAFDATKGSTECSKLVFGVEAEVWTVAVTGRSYRRNFCQNLQILFPRTFFVFTYFPISFLQILEPEAFQVFCLLLNFQFGKVSSFSCSILEKKKR